MSMGIPCFQQIINVNEGMNFKMKKTLAVLLMAVMILGASINVFADPGSFLMSPSVNPAPTLISSKFEDEDCTAQLVITAYTDRDKLDDTLKELIERAYSDIAGTDDLTKLNSDLAKIAEEKNIKGSNLAVSDLFDISPVGCQEHDGHYSCDIVIDADTLHRFVALMHMDENGQWIIVDGAKVTNNGEHLEFTVDSLTPFAIVVDTTEEGDLPNTGDNSNIRAYVCMMFISALVIAVLVINSKKQRA